MRNLQRYENDLVKKEIVMICDERVWRSTTKLLKIDCKFGLSLEQWKSGQGSSMMCNSVQTTAQQRFCWLSLPQQNSHVMLCLSARMSWEQTFGWVTPDSGLWLSESLGILLTLIKVDPKLLGPKACSYPQRDLHSPPFFNKYQLVTEQFPMSIFLNSNFVNITMTSCQEALFSCFTIGTNKSTLVSPSSERCLEFLNTLLGFKLAF